MPIVAALMIASLTQASPAHALSCPLSLGQSPAPTSPAQQSPTLTNDDVIRMVKAEISPGIITATINANATHFDLSPDGLIALKAAGVPDEIVNTMMARARPGDRTPAAVAAPDAPEPSSQLAAAKDTELILRTFKTLYVDASGAQFFKSDQMQAALGKDKGFAALNVSIVNNLSLADVVLDVGYTFAWDYPFTLRHRNTSLVIASGKGTGAFSGPAGAKSVAREVVKILTPYRVGPAATRKKS